MRRSRSQAGGLPTGNRDSSYRPAKLLPPPVPLHHLRRPRLLDLVDDKVAAPLLLVAAPAGTGKTALLAGWSEGSARHVAWLSLDPADRTAGTFAADVLTAVDGLLPGPADRADRHQSGGPAGDILARTWDELGTRQAPTSVLVLDNVQVVEAAGPVLALLELLLTRLPAWLHVVLVSRHPPPLPLDRWRAAGRLGDIRGADLMFSSPEAAQLLGRLAPALAADEVDTLAGQARGWPAGLQLAALAGRAGDGDARATKAEYDTLARSYVLHEVLGAEPPELVEALRRLAIVQGGDAQLARTLIQRVDAPALWSVAQSRGLLATGSPADGSPADGSFAMHPFIRAVLLDELTATAPQQVVELHARAARLFESRGEVALALEHWLLANEPATALQLLAEKATDLYDAGRQDVILATIAVIPADVASRDLAAMVENAWCHLLVDRRRYLELVEQIGWWAEHTSPGPQLRPRVMMLQSFAAAMRGEWGDAVKLARAAMAELGDDAWRDILGRFGWNVMAGEFAMSERWTDSAAERELVLAASRDPHRGIDMEGIRALGQALAGDPVRALRTAAEVRAMAPVEDMSVLRAEVLTGEGIAHREIGERRRAQAELEDIARTPLQPMAQCGILSLLELTQLRLDEHDVQAAEAMFERARRAVQDAAPSGELSRLAAVGTLVELEAGNVAAARGWAEQVADPFWAAISASRVHLAGGDAPAALSAVRSATPRCARHQVVLDLTRARAADDDEEALELVTIAAQEASVHGMLQTVASEGPGVLRLVERAAWATPTAWIDGLRRLAAVGGGPALRRLVVPASEQLSARERDVLRTLPSRLTTREIADELGISVNTLKYHVKAIYRKLGVNSRLEAAEIARQLTGSAGGSGAERPAVTPPAGFRGPDRA